MRAGSYGHRSLFCESFTSSHRELEIDAIVWPELSNRALAFFRGISSFGTMLAKKHRAAALLAAYAATVDDPVVRAAIALQGAEESQNARLIEAFLRAYDIPYRTSPMPPLAASRSEYYAHGYRAALETFLFWGLFAAAGAAELFPRPFTRIFDELLDRQARHLVFFSNYVAYERAREGRDGFRYDLRDTALGYCKAALRLAASFVESVVVGRWFTRSNPVLDGVGICGVLARSLAENGRRMAPFDPRLKRPRFVPLCADLVLLAARTRRPKSKDAAARAQT